MARSAENPGISRTEANWVDMATSVVLLLTLVAVAWYTWEAAPHVDMGANFVGEGQRWPLINDQPLISGFAGDVR
jgi:hypothetical protein